MTVAHDHLSRRRLAARPVFIAALIVGFSLFEQGAQLVTRGGAMGGAIDSVAYRARVALDEHKVSLFSGCVGHQPVRPRA